MDVTKLREELENMLEAVRAPLPEPTGSSDSVKAWKMQWDSEHRDKIHREISTLSQAILALEACRRMEREIGTGEDAEKRDGPYSYRPGDLIEMPGTLKGCWDEILKLRRIIHWRDETIGALEKEPCEPA
jgi:hypothetical protein